jgi:hypothetical protein
MSEGAKETPEPTNASSGAKPAGEAGREETPGEMLEHAARRDVRSVLAKALLNTAHLYEQAAYSVGKR